MNWRSMDLNLLVVFDAVAKERNVVRAASSLNMSPSALSHALSRLRAMVGDDLFTRTPAGMEPTARALSLAGPVRMALDVIEGALAPTFDPASSRHAFVVALDNRSALMLAAPFARHVSARAPNVSLDIVPSGTLVLPQRLEHGNIDIAVTCTPMEQEQLDAVPLFDDDYVVLLHPGHRDARSGAIDVETLAASPHLSISSTGEDDAFVDAELARRGLARHIALRAPLHSATAILSGSDAIAVLGRKTATAFARASDLIVRELPFPSPRSTTSLVWHRRWNGAPAHRWLRDTLRISVESVIPQTVAAPAEHRLGAERPSRRPDEPKT